MAAFREQVLAALAQSSSPVPAGDLAKRLRCPVSEVNRVLYAEQKKGSVSMVKGGGSSAPLWKAAAPAAAPRSQDRSSTTRTGVTPKRQKILDENLAAWKETLLDLTRRNNLLYFKESKNQTLSLDASKPEIRSQLLSGKSVSVAKLFASDEERIEALRRTRIIAGKERENREERSLETLHLTVGEVTWEPEGDQRDRPPRAPLLLVPAQLSRDGRTSDFSLKLSLDGAEVNQTLKYKVKRDFGIELDGDLGPALDEGVPLVEIVRRMLLPKLRRLPKMTVADRFILGNFSFAKLAMVQDLDDSRETLGLHHVIMAIIGDREAGNELRGQVGEPQLESANHISPSDEFLILDADSSQNDVINAIVAGRSFAFDGPPGTGKSQTIANAIAVLAARGKKVLFVAEKRAAIDAVVRRLTHAGLGQLVMDYHGTDRRKREIVDNIKAAIGGMRATQPRGVTAVHETLSETRQYLLDRSTAVHSPREPWRYSIYQLMEISKEAEENGAAVDGVNLPRTLLNRLTFDRIHVAKQTLRRFARAGGLQTGTGAELWRESTVGSEADADVVLDALDEVDEDKLRQIYVDMERVAIELGAPVTKSSASRLPKPDRLQAVVAAATHCASLGDELGWPMFAEPLDRHEEALLRAESKARILWQLWSPSFRASVRAVRAATSKKLSSREALNAVKRTRSAVGQWRRATGGAEVPRSRPRALDTAVAAADELASISERFAAIPAVVDALRDDLARAATLVDALRASRNLGRTAHVLVAAAKELEEIGLGRLISSMRSQGIDPTLAEEGLMGVWARSLLEVLSAKEPTLMSADSTVAARATSEFSSADRQHLATTPDRIKVAWTKNYKAAALKFVDENMVLDRELQKKSRLLPIRKLFSQTKNVLCAVKPCWVMSPLSVSVIRPDPSWFDVVIFDEASQVQPADAITSIKAAKQVVVAGDDQQLPPTTFFAGSDVDVLDDADDNDDDAVPLGAYESVLSLVKAIITRPRQLQWHYRSRDERLIAFSNEHVYGKSLITFPDNAQDSPISLEIVASSPANISRGATNEAEVDHVVELVRNHARKHPDESLGVIALGSPHANAIEQALDRARQTDDLIDHLLRERETEPTFVKNLERVQGDERDAIILTIGYGRNAAGQINYNFGPINGRYGTRRLNVATTRAKKRLTVVSTFGGEELDKGRSKGGVAFLRDYLIYAGTKAEWMGDTLTPPPELNAFERSVLSALTGAGLDVVPQLGVGKYRIDFAVRHRSDSARFALAVECDGASYHSQPTARERDRLRQEALEARGWNFYRIWSTNWFNNPEQELEQLVAEYERVISI